MTPIPEVTVVKSEPADAVEDSEQGGLLIKVEEDVFDNTPGILRECLVCNKIVTAKDVCCDKSGDDDILENVVELFVGEEPLLLSKEAPQKRSKRTGRRSIHGKGPFQCVFCFKMCRMMSQLEVHILTHIGEKPHHCPSCDWNFSDNSALRRHQMARHQGGIPTRYGCSYCSKRFYHTGHLEIHERTHTGEKPFKCDLCPKSYTQKPHLTMHMKSFHIGEKPYPCTLCPKSFPTRCQLSIHQNSHSEKRTLGCEICGAKYKHRGALTRHMRAVHTGEKPYKCKLCGRPFCDSSDLARHVRRHEGDKRFVCLFCGRAFIQNGVLWVHLRGHTQEKPFDCPFSECDRTFSSSADKTRHSKSHYPTLAYFCTFCGKGFKQKRSRDTHVLGHIRERPIECPKCSEMFQAREQKERHMRNTH